MYKTSNYNLPDYISYILYEYQYAVRPRGRYLPPPSEGNDFAHARLPALAVLATKTPIRQVRFV
jgi:hypothetical protein